MDCSLMHFIKVINKVFKLLVFYFGTILKFLCACYRLMCDSLPENKKILTKNNLRNFQ